jgi:phosphoribosylaminoimidazole carboxylase
MVKSRLGAYDGRGNFAVHKEEDVGAAWQALNRVGGGGLFVEAWVPFVRELSVIVVKGVDGSLAAYPPVHTIQRDSICHLVFAPCGPTPSQGPSSHSSSSGTGSGGLSVTVPPLPPTQVALGAVGALEGAGVYGVELFELVGGGCLLNEIAPRVHNSGHYSTEGAKCSQFEQHIRAVCGLPLGPTALRVPAAAMVNILASGGEGEGVLPPLALAALSHPGGASLHWYSKGGVSKAGRKVGHVTVTGGSVGEVRRSVDALLAAGSSSGSSGSPSAATPPIPPVVGIVMGSDSDLGCMAGAAEVLQAFGVPFEITLVSAHRTPGRLEEYGRGARARGLKVIIAGAGGAAHLPGMLASITPLPVIGVPVPLKHLDGVDSLYSILQMPKGVPVATMAIGNAANAGLMAVRILEGGGEEGLLDKMEEYQKKMEGEVLDKAAKLERVGWEQYLREKK